MVTPTAAPGRLRRWALLALLASAVVCTGCIRVEIGIRVNDDGSGAISILSALDAEALSTLSALDAEDQRAFGEDDGGEIESPFSDLDAADLPPGATVEAYDEDGFIGVRASVPFAAGDDIPDAIEAALSDAGDDLSGELAGTAGLFERFDLHRDGGGWRFDAVVSPLNQEALSGGDVDALGGAVAAQLLEDATFTIRLELPGDVEEHNADAVDGGALVWSLDLLSDQPRDLMARTGGGGGVSTIVTIVVVIALLIAAVAAIAWSRSRRRSAAGA